MAAAGGVLVVAVLRLPGVFKLPLDGEDDDEATAAVDRVLRKYAKAKMLMENVQDNFINSWEELGLKQNTDEWKQVYYWA